MLTEAWPMGFEFERPPRGAIYRAPRPTVVYLDHWCWDQLTRDRAGRLQGQPAEDIYGFLKARAHAGAIVLPLSQAHYREHWVRRNEDARWDMAVVMAELSGFTTISGHELSAWEAQLATVNHFDLGLDVAHPHVFGWGLMHCLTGKEQRARVVDTRTGQAAEWTDFPSELQQDLSHLEDECAYRFELAMLARREPRLEAAGMPTIPPIPEQVGLDFYQQQLHVRDAIDRHGRSPTVVRNSVEFPAFRDSLTLLDQAAAQLGRSWEPVLSSLAEQPPDERMAAIHAILATMPVQGTFTELRVRAHLKPEFRWAPSDCMDFFAMAQIIPFVDYVVTDRRTYNLLTEAPLPSQCSAIILRNLAELRDRLNTAG